MSGSAPFSVSAQFLTIYRVVGFIKAHDMGGLDVLTWINIFANDVAFIIADKPLRILRIRHPNKVMDAIDIHDLIIEDVLECL